MEFSNFFSWADIVSIGGMTAIIILFTQFTKGAADFIYDKICAQIGTPSCGFPTRAWTALLAEIIIITTYGLNGDIVDGKSLWLTIINGLVLATVAMLAYDGTKAALTKPSVPEEPIVEYPTPTFALQEAEEK
jgi:hypothetical protein